MDGSNPGDVHPKTGQKYRTEYGGHLGKYLTVNALENQPDLHCFECKDGSLYHDAIAYWHEEDDDLLCVKCFGSLDKPNKNEYKKVLTQH